MRVKSLLCVFFLLLMAGGVFAQVQTGTDCILNVNFVQHGYSQ